MLPLELQQLLEVSYSKMEQDLKNILPPFYRKQIYDFLLNSDRPTAYYWLSVIVAEYVLPFWKSKCSDDSFVKQLLEVAKQSIYGNIPYKEVRDEFEDSWKKKEILGTNNVEIGNEFYVLEAVVETLHDILGKTPFGGVEIKEFYTDERDLDYTCEDVASSAMFAFVGLIWDESFSYKKSKEFWEWWLGEAVGQAWDKAVEELK